MAIKIEQEIVGFSIGKENEDIAEKKKLNVEQLHEDVARPEMLLGSTYKIKTPLSDHALYVTINDIILNHNTVHEQRRPFEVFINSKNMEHFQWVTALTRVISAVFRKGGDVAFLPNELKQVFDPQGGYFKKGGRFMPSLVAEIGEAIESHMKSIGLIEEEELSDPHKAMIEEKRKSLQQATQMDAVEVTDFPDIAQLCVKCNVKAMVMMDNCLTCLNCGESKCG